MPIAPELRKHYRTPEWFAARDNAIARSKGLCERCGKPSGHLVEILKFGIWRPLSYNPYELQFWCIPADVDEAHVLAEFERSDRRVATDGDEWWKVHPGYKHTRAHLNHDPTDNRFENVLNLCNRCHLVHDKAHHADTRARRKDAGRPILQVGAIAV